MRDENRIREKLELSLDSRQVVSLFIGGIVGLGVVFVLGVMVGKQLPQQGKAAPHDLLATLDSTADAGPVALTFQQDLVKPTPTLAASEARAAKPVDRPATKLDPHPAEAKPDARSSDSRAPAKDDAKPVPVAAVETPKAEQVKVAPKADSKPATDAKPADVKPAAQPEPPPMDQKLAAAFTAAEKQSPKAAPAPVPSSGFTVQVAASQQKDEADGVMQKLRASGLRPYLVDADIPGKGHWYRVRLGTFASKTDAQKYVADLKRETGYSAFVTSAK